MAKVVQTTLQIAENNVEQYCIADGLSLNTGGYAIRLYLNGHTRGSAILNDAAKEVLYPSATAHPFKIDSFIRANKSGGSMTISLQFNGTSVQSETGDWGTELKNKTKEGISDPVVINSNRSTEIKWHIKGSSTVSRFSIASTKLTFYFNQYEMRPLVGDNANGIQKVTVSNASPCQGDTVVFTTKLVQGATWVGWYSDAACTNLVSTEQNYSVTPSSDITLYAKATVDATLYNVSAVAGSEITSVSVSDSIVPDGSTATFTAQVNENCSFEAWYSDNTYTTVVSTENPYTATITADTTLYAKAHRNSLNISVGTAEHGTASVSATTVPYGDDVTFTFTPEDETWELYGWYSDLALTQLVSEANPYTFTATEDVTLYPKVGKVRYTISIGRDKDTWLGNASFEIDIAVLYYDQLTRTEINYLRTGEYDKIDASKIILKDSVSGSNIFTSVWKTIKCPCDAYVAVYSPPVSSASDDNADYAWFVKDGETVTYWPYYWFQPIKDTKITSRQDGARFFCDCSAILKEGIDYAYATTPTHQGYNAIFEAEVSSGYTFSGWYSDEACTTSVSTDNPAYVVAPRYTTESASTTSLTLYAKAIKATYTIRVGTAAHCTTSVSAATAYYGDTVTFNCMVNKGYGFKGWYSDEGLTQLVSENSEYVHNVTGNIKLWPKVEIKIYNLILHPTGYDAINFNRETKIKDVECLYENDSHHSPTTSYAEWTIYGKYGNTSSNPASLGFYVAGEKFANIPDDAQITDINILIRMGNDTPVSISNDAQLHGIYTAQRKTRITGASYDQVGTKKYAGTGISQTKVISYILTNTEVGSWMLASLKAGKFGIVLSASYDPPISDFVQHSVNIYNIDISISYTLLPNTSATSLLFKCNGSWIKAKSVFKKTNGAWVKQEDLSAIFSGESSGTASNYVYGGSV